MGNTVPMDGSRQNNRGFTLVELMITVIIVAILLAVAAPGLVTMLERNRIQSTASNLYGSLMLARSEALKRNQPVTVCQKLAASDNCDTVGSNAGKWEQGWIVFFDQDGGGTADPNEVLAIRPGLTNDDTLRVAGLNSMFYRSDGGSSEAATFVICNSAGDTDSAREIIVEVTGRPRVKENTSTCTP